MRNSVSSFNTFVFNPIAPLLTSLFIHTHTRAYRQMIFLLLSIISVVTNAGLTVFTMTTLRDLHTATRFWIFVLFQWVCFTLQVHTYCFHSFVSSFFCFWSVLSLKRKGRSQVELCHALFTVFPLTFLLVDSTLHFFRLSCSSWKPFPTSPNA